MKLITGPRLRWLVQGAFLIAILLLQSGCANTSTRHASERPWNTPKSWEHGLPSGMYEGR